MQRSQHGTTSPTRCANRDVRHVCLPSFHPFHHFGRAVEASLDIFWLKDESLSESENLPSPDVLAQEIVEELEAGLEQFKEIAGDLGGETVGIQTVTDGSTVNRKSGR